jgi:hypothetical protein
MTFKVLGQSAPAATTNTDVYTVPSGKSAVVSTLFACNRSASAVTYRIALRPAGTALANQHYVAYDVSLAANASDLWTAGIALAATDVVTVYASSAGMSFSLTGDET